MKRNVHGFFKGLLSWSVSKDLDYVERSEALQITFNQIGKKTNIEALKCTRWLTLRLRLVLKSSSDLLFFHSLQTIIDL